MSFACVALSLPFKFHTGGADGLWYAVPEELSSIAKVGSRALVPLGKREKTGVIIALATEAPEVKAKLRPLVDVFDAEPVFDDEFLAWTKWVASYYLTSWGEVLSAALPVGLKPESKSRVHVTDEDAAFLDLTTRQRTTYHEIAKYSEGVALQHLQQQLRSESLYATLNALERKGLVRIE